MTTAESTEDKIFTAGELAEYFKISESQVYVLINRAENPLPSFYISERKLRVRMSDLRAWIDKQTGVALEIKEEENG